MSVPAIAGSGLPPGTRSISFSAMADTLALPAGVLLPFSHIVSDTTPPHIKHLYDVPNVVRFKGHLELLCRHCRPLDISEVAELPGRHENRSGAQAFLLSFDDGMREVADIIAPLLRHYGIPAIFFVNSSTIDNAQLMWRHKISLIIDRYKQNPRRIPPEFGYGRPDQVVRRLKALRYRDERVINELARFYEIDFNDYLQRARPYLTTHEILALSEMGFAIGAHTHTHPHLNELSFEEQKDQISRSVVFIRSRMVACRWFAFPFDDRGISSSVFAYLKDLDLAVSFGTSECRVDSVPFSFQRFRLDGPHARSSLQGVIAELLMKSAVRRLSRTMNISRS